MDEQELEQARDLTKRLFGEKRAKTVEDSLESMSPRFHDYVMEIFGFYNRPVLDLKTRSAITIAVLTALGRSQELVLHIRGGLNAGFTEEQIREIIMQVAMYAGVPVGVEAFMVADKMFAKIREKGND